jgi:hypothetical protein
MRGILQFPMPREVIRLDRKRSFTQAIGEDIIVAETVIDALPFPQLLKLVPFLAVLEAERCAMNSPKRLVCNGKFVRENVGSL